MQTENTVYDLTDYGLLKVSGLDAKKLLQGQLTCDVEKITPTASCLGAHCNPQGRIISLFYLFLMQETYYLLMPRNMVELSMAALKKYAVFYKVALSDASHHFVIVGYRGKEIALTMQTANIAVHASRHIIITDIKDKKSLWDTLVGKAQLADMNAWKCLDIHDGIPMIYPESSGQFLPHEINLHALNGISFDKGCYTGQEIIARMHYRGKLKTGLHQARITETTLPPPGSDISFLQEDQTQMKGSLVYACHEAYNNYYALIVARK
jgi:tRNA-modifying protein YgfZ